MIGIDTNILLRWLIDEEIWPDDNPGQTKAVAKLLNGDRQKFYVNAVVLSETLWILTKLYKQPASMIVEILERLLASSNLEVQDRKAVLATKISFVNHKIGIHDRLIAEMNILAGCHVTMTYDKAAARMPGFQLLKSRG